MNNLYNTNIELATRTLLLLSIDKYPKTIDRILALDFITTYSKHFNITSKNLHGYNIYLFGEFSSRRILIKKAIEFLLLYKYVSVFKSNVGFEFKINDSGLNLIKSMKSTYAKEYLEIAKIVIEKSKLLTTEELIYKIGLYAQNSIKR